MPPALLRAFVNARSLTDRHPPSLGQSVLAEFMRQGYFAGHVRRMRLLYREQRDTLVAELERRLGDRLQLDVPDHGMNLVAYPRQGVSDVKLERAAREHGVVVRAISPLYRRARPRSGLMFGFTGFPREAIAAAVARLAEIPRASFSALSSARRGSASRCPGPGSSAGST